MCDACDTPLHERSSLHLNHAPSAAFIDRRGLLVTAGLGGLVAAAAALGLPDAVADAMAPPFETAQLGEDQRVVAAIASAGQLTAKPDVLPAVLPAAMSAHSSSHSSSQSSFQSSSGISAPHIVTRAQWGADESIRTSARGFAPIRKFVVHHTASPNNPKHPVDVMQEMYQYHVIGRGFSDVGYNFAIDQHGVIYEARWARHYAPGELHDGEDTSGLGVVGAHALGVNAGSCGIVLIGDFTKRRPTSAALSSLIHLISWKAARHRVDALRSDRYISIYGLSRVFPNIAGHRQTGQTACPGGYLFDQLPYVRKQVAKRAGRYPAKTVNMAHALRWTSGYELAGITTAKGSSSSSGSSSSDSSGFSSSTGSSRSNGARLSGYRLFTADGRVISIGRATKYGSPRDKGLRVGRAIGGVPGRSWYLTADPQGRVAGFGGTPGSVPRSLLQAVDVASTPSGQGHWVLTTLGGVYAYGSASHHGSLPRLGLHMHALKLRSSGRGFGYWILGANGRVYAFGDAADLGSSATSGAVDFWPTPSGRGYWVVTADGRVGAHGDANHYGDVPGLGVRWSGRAVGIVGMPSGHGYAVTASDGGIFNFGSSPFLGSLGGSGRQVVGMALAFG